MSALRELVERVGLPWRLVAEVALLGLIGAGLWCATMLLVAPMYHLLAEQVHPSVALHERLGDTQEYIVRRGHASTFDLWQVWFVETAQSWAEYLPGDIFDSLCIVLGLAVLIVVLDGCTRYRHHVRVADYAHRAQIELRQQSLDRLLHGDYEDAITTPSTDRLARSTNDLNEVGLGIQQVGVVGLREPLKVVGCLTAALVVNWRLTLFFLIGIVLVGGAVGWVGKKLKRAVRRALEATSTVFSVLRETFHLLKVVIAYGGRDRQVAQLEDRQRSLLRTVLGAERLRAVVSPLVETLAIAGVVLVLLPAAYLTLRGTKEVAELTLAETSPRLVDLAMLFTFLVAMVDPLRKLAPLWSSLQRAEAAAERVLETIGEREVRPQSASPPEDWSRIDLAGISYTYPGAESPALDRVDVTLERGDVVAVVGTNGSGKSTLADVLAGLLRPSDGRVRLDDESVGDLVVPGWRSRIGLVPQQASLFEGSILENVRYGRESATDDEIREVLSLVGLDGWLETLPNQLETNVGPHGNRLSGGQRQRITIARAMIRRPDVLILDEPTSAADPASRAAFHRAVRTDHTERITLLVTHEMPVELLELVTRVIVLDRGQVVAVGSDEQLTETCPIYRTLRHAA